MRTKVGYTQPHCPAPAHDPVVASSSVSQQKGSRRYGAGYTLIEMLITITIFSGLLIIVLGSFASSSSSGAKVNTLREKSQAARTLIDQITNDLRYVDTTAQLIDNNDSPQNGFMINPAGTQLTMALLLPNADPNAGLVRKEYLIERFGSHQTLTLREGRDCNRADFLQFDHCGQRSDKTDLLKSTYSLNQESPEFPSELGGISVQTARIANPPISPYVSIVLSLKPIGLNGGCNAADSGTCYKVSTKVNMGTSR